MRYLLWKTCLLIVVAIIPLYAQNTSEAAYTLNGEGIGYFNAENFSSAVDSFTKAAELLPGDASIRFNLAASYSKLKQFDKAAENFMRVTKLRPTTRSRLTNWVLPTRKWACTTSQNVTLPRLSG